MPFRPAVVIPILGVLVGVAAAAATAAAQAPPTITITAPTGAPGYAAPGAALTLEGTTTGAVTTVAWTSDRGESGIASGTSPWYATDVPLLAGTTVVTVTATGPGGTAAGGAELRLDTYNPTGFSLYGTHGKTLRSFQPTGGSTIEFTTRLRLTSLQPGLRWSLSRIEYLVDGTLLAAVTDHVPQGPMQVDQIAWGPGMEWAAAFDASLQPVGSAGGAVGGLQATGHGLQATGHGPRRVSVSGAGRPCSARRATRGSRRRWS